MDKYQQYSSRKCLMAASTLALAAPFFLAGCGGGGGNSSSTPEPAPCSGYVGAGVAALTGVVNTSSGTPLQNLSANLTTAQTDFQQAIAQNPNDPNALTGLAIAQAASAAVMAAEIDPSITFTGLARPRVAASASSLTQSVSLSQLSSGLMVWNLRPPGTPSAPLAVSLSQTGAARAHDITVSQIATTVAALDTQLATAQTSLNTALTQIGSNNSYEFEACPGTPFAVTVNNQTEHIGKAELQGLAAVIATLRAVTGVSQAYSLDLGTFNANQTLVAAFPSSFPTTVTNPLTRGTLTPAQYLPPNPYLTLTSTGTSQTQAALAQLQLAFGDLSAGLTTIQARMNNNTNGTFLFSGGLITSANVATAQTDFTNDITLLTMSGLQTFQFPSQTGATTTLRVAVHDFLTNPPASLSAAAPTYTVMGTNNNGTAYTSYTLSPNGVTFPTGNTDSAFQSITVDNTTTIGSLLSQQAGDIELAGAAALIFEQSS